MSVQTREHPSLEEKVDALYNAIVGSPSLGIRGLVDLVQEDHMRVARLERSALLISGIVVGLLVKLLLPLLPKFL